MKDAIKAITALQIDAATLTGAYDPFSPTGIPEACQFIRIINHSKADVGISYDGITTHEFLGQDADMQLYFQSNSRPNNKIACLAKGSNVCVIGNPGVGTIYFIGYYQES